MQSFNFRPNADGQAYRISLFSLEEYEAEGGQFTDAGNGGEDMRSERDSFVCAAGVEDVHDDGLPASDVLKAAGCEEVWHDSSTGFFLLRDFPAEAPLQARMLH
jgi:hypothetical protein